MCTTNKRSTNPGPTMYNLVPQMRNKKADCGSYLWERIKIFSQQFCSVESKFCNCNMNKVWLHFQHITRPAWGGTPIYMMRRRSDHKSVWVLGKSVRYYCLYSAIFPRLLEWFHFVRVCFRKILWFPLSEYDAVCS